MNQAHKIYEEHRLVGTTKKRKDESIATYENRINEEVIKDIAQESDVSFETKTNRFFQAVEGITNVGSLLNFTRRNIGSKNKEITSIVQRAALAFGDFGTVTKAVDQGIASNPSIIMKLSTTHNAKLIATLNIRDKLKKNTTEIISLLHKQNYTTPVFRKFL